MFRGGDVGLVARRVSQRPPRRSEIVTHHVPAGGQCRTDASLGLFVGHPHGEVYRAAFVRARLVHMLEPEGWSPIVRVDEVLVRAVRPALIPEDGLPEGHDL